MTHKGLNMAGCSWFVILSETKDLVFVGVKKVE